MPGLFAPLHSISYWLASHHVYATRAIANLTHVVLQNVNEIRLEISWLYRHVTPWIILYKQVSPFKTDDGYHEIFQRFILPSENKKIALLPCIVSLLSKMTQSRDSTYTAAPLTPSVGPKCSCTTQRRRLQRPKTTSHIMSQPVSMLL